MVRTLVMCLTLLLVMAQLCVPNEVEKAYAEDELTAEQVEELKRVYRYMFVGLLGEDYGSNISDMYDLVTNEANDAYQWIYDNYPTLTQNGRIQLASIPDAVKAGLIRAAVKSMKDGSTLTNFPSTIVLDRCHGKAQSAIVHFSESAIETISSNLVGRNHVIVVLKHGTYNLNRVYVALAFSDKPWSYVVTDNTTSASMTMLTPQGASHIASGNYAASTSNDQTVFDTTISGVQRTNSGGTFNTAQADNGAEGYYVGGKSLAYTTISFVQSTPVASNVPSAISDGLQAALVAADTAAQESAIQSIVEAINDGMPVVNIPETDPVEPIDNYNTYITIEVGGGGGEVVDNSDLLRQIIALLDDMLDELETLDHSTNDLVSLTALQTTLDDILDELETLDHSTNDLVSLTDVETYLDEILSAITDLQDEDTNVPLVRGYLAGILTDLDNLLLVLEDWPEPTGGTVDLSDVTAYLDELLDALTNIQDEDSNALLIRGYLAGIYGDTQNMLDLLDEQLQAIVDDVGVWHDDFIDFWDDLRNYLDAILYDLEHLNVRSWNPRTPQTPEPDPGTEIVPWEETLNITALRDALTRLMSKFPFATINNIVLIITAFVRPAVAPEFDLPMPNPSDWSAPYMVHVDLSIWDVPAAVMRTGITLWVIAKVSRRTVAMWTREEGGGDA